MTLQATAFSELKEDTVYISLAVEVEAPDQVLAGKKLTAALDEVFKRAKGTDNVDVRSGGYNVWPSTNKQGKIVGWRGQGELILVSKDFEAASSLVSKLGDKAAISNIRFELSREARDAEERKLLGQAAQAFQARALAAAQAFGFKGYP
jgi:predicted secreted protein